MSRSARTQGSFCDTNHTFMTICRPTAIALPPTLSQERDTPHGTGPHRGPQGIAYPAARPHGRSGRAAGSCAVAMTRRRAPERGHAKAAAPFRKNRQAHARVSPRARNRALLLQGSEELQGPVGRSACSVRGRRFRISRDRAGSGPHHRPVTRFVAFPRDKRDLNLP